MSKVNVKKLTYPLWFKILFYIITVVTPIVAVIVQGLKSPSTTFRVTFTVLCLCVLIWTFLRKFILRNIEQRLVSEKTALQHDYSIEVGSADKIKWLWFTNELWLTFINAIQIILFGTLILLLAVGIQNSVIQVKGTSLFIVILYLIAYISKVVYILIARGKELNDVESDK